jgi:hypothetical protein
VRVAKEQGFHVLRDEARRVKLEAEQHGDLAARQHRARSARVHTDPLGMIDIHLRFEPHVGAPIVARNEAEAQRRARTAKSAGDEPEPFERYLADAYAAMLTAPGKVTGRARRPEVVYLVDYRIAKRGWTHVEPGEVCKIPGVGPVSPDVARDAARDAFINAVMYDGVDLRQFKRWSRGLTKELEIALRLGEPPDFDGIKCVDCGNRFHTEFDHVEPRVARGPASTRNLKPRCWPCHRAKSERDRRAGKLRAPPET